MTPVARRAVFSAADKLLEEYKDTEPEADQEFDVEAILDERRRGTETAFRVKWQARSGLPLKGSSCDSLGLLLSL